MKKILVIEDEQALREDIIEILQYENFEVLGASNGTKGIELAHTHLPDLIICDIMMADVDGYSVLKELRSSELTANVAFIFLTARTSREDMRRGMELGADDYVTKPFTQAELLATITARLNKHVRLTEEYERRLNDLRENINRALPHELRTPLTGILGYAQMMMEEAETLDPPQIHEMAQGIDRAAHRILRLTENYLLYAQIEFLLADPERIHAVRQHRVDDVKFFIKDVAFQKAGEFDRVNDILYDGIDASVYVSQESLEKIVREIVDNALKFSEKDSPVQITGMTEDNFYRLSVTNIGHGFTPEQISHIGAYMQFDRRIYEQTGVGLGLIIAKRLTELHGGTLNIVSGSNHQTTVTVSIPCVE